MSDNCELAIETAASLLSEQACDGNDLAKIDMSGEFGGTLMWVPQELKDEIGVNPNNPEDLNGMTDSEREEAIESCMGSEWARETSEAFAGEDPEARQAVARKLCEGLLS